MASSHEGSVKERQCNRLLKQAPPLARKIIPAQLDALTGRQSNPPRASAMGLLKAVARRVDGDEGSAFAITRNGGWLGGADPRGRS
ncbi:hypothetical protein [Carnimonas bestiolae]|uniref:hypothetical protein n=1 Tax=Carnimonas bestiolae TaxID=3402172 RepID=UPI003F4AB3CE